MLYQLSEIADDTSEADAEHVAKLACCERGKCASSF